VSVLIVLNRSRAVIVPRGGVAQTVERLLRMQEAQGSIPCSSTFFFSLGCKCLFLASDAAVAAMSCMGSKMRWYGGDVPDRGQVPAIVVHEALVDQWIDHQTSDLGVAGSSPVGGLLLAHTHGLLFTLLCVFTLQQPTNPRWGGSWSVR
jgi:hypothetical protein